MAVDMMVSLNNTALERQIQLRRGQLSKVNLALQGLSIEVASLTTVCNMNDGDDCNISLTACSMHGKYILNACQCEMGWIGSNCAIPTCNNIPANDTNVCNGLGTCISNNTCLCKSGFSGSTCLSVGIVGDDISGRRYADGACATSCKDYLSPSNSTRVYNGSVGTGYYWLKPDTTELKIYCEMKIAGGGLTQLTNAVQNSKINTGSQSRYYVYARDINTWYKSPASTTTWDWASFKYLPGSYSYTTNNGATINSFSCTQNEVGTNGVGCSNGPGAISKVIVVGLNGDGVGRVCQDGIFGANICISGIPIYIQ